MKFLFLDWWMCRKWGTPNYGLHNVHLWSKQWWCWLEKKEIRWNMSWINFWKWLVRRRELSDSSDRFHFVNEELWIRNMILMKYEGNISLISFFSAKWLFQNVFRQNLWGFHSHKFVTRNLQENKTVYSIRSGINHESIVLWAKTMLICPEPCH